MKKPSLPLTLDRLVCNPNAALKLLAALMCGVDFSHSARGAVTEAWVQRYSNVVSNSNDQVVKVVHDAAGDIIVTGNTEGDMRTIKYSGANGSALWQQRYNGSGSSDDHVRAIAVDGSGNIVVTGDSNFDYYTAKYAGG